MAQEAGGDNGNESGEGGDTIDEQTEAEDDEDDCDLPSNVAQRMFRAPPHFRAPIYCMEYPTGGWLNVRGGDWFPDQGRPMPEFILGHTGETPNWMRRPPPLPESPPHPDDEFQLLAIFANFNKVWMSSRMCYVTTEEGHEIEKILRPRFEILRLYAGCILYFSRMAELTLKSRKRFQQMLPFADTTPGPVSDATSRKGISVELLKKLFYFSPFLSHGESPEAYIETFNFGMALINLRQKIKKDGWWRSKHIFHGTQVLGVHEDFKPFFDLLRFDYTSEN